MQPRVVCIINFAGDDLAVVFLAVECRKREVLFGCLYFDNQFKTLGGIGLDRRMESNILPCHILDIGFRAAYGIYLAEANGQIEQG